MALSTDSPIGHPPSRAGDGGERGCGAAVLATLELERAVRASTRRARLPCCTFHGATSELWANTALNVARQAGRWAYTTGRRLHRERPRMELQAPDEESMIRIAVADLDGRFASIDRARIEGTVGRLVHEWFERARVKNFVGIIAERHARAWSWSKACCGTAPLVARHSCDRCALCIPPTSLDSASRVTPVRRMSRRVRATRSTGESWLGRWCAEPDRI